MSEPWLRGRQYVEISPEQFEVLVLQWLKGCAGELINFRVIQRKHTSGKSGQYEIDIHIEFTVFESAQITVLVECKRFTNPVKRDAVMLLEGKLQDAGAHKGIIFSTAGFQKGAIEYATHHGVALVDVADGRSNYCVRSRRSGPVEPPPWIKSPEFIGWLQSTVDGKSVSSSLIEDARLDPLAEWLTRKPA